MGQFGRTVFTIRDCHAKSANKFYITILYSLREIPGYFYPQELKLVNYDKSSSKDSSASVADNTTKANSVSSDNVAAVTPSSSAS